MKTTSETTEMSRHIVQTIYKAMASGDVNAVLELIDENIVCYESPSLPYGKAYRGHSELMALFEPVTKYLAIEQLKVDHLIADGENVVAVIRLPIRSSGIEAIVSEHHLVRNGKVVEQRIFFFEPTLVR